MSGTTRTISTRLVVESAKEWKRQMREAQTELTALNKQEKLVQAQYLNNRNTLEALIAVQNSYKSTLAHLKAQEQLQIAAIEDHSQKAQELATAYEAAVKALEAYNEANPDEASKPKREQSKEYQTLVANVNKYDNAIRQNKDNIERWSGALAETQTRIIKKTAAIKDYDRYIEDASQSTEHLTHLIDEQGKVEERTAREERRRMEAEEERERKRLEREEARLESLAQAMVLAGAKKSVEELYKLLKQCVDAAIEFESAIAGVSKTTDFTDGELAVFASQLQELSTQIPITTTELAAIAENAGQLGIADQDILKFTEVMANLGVSTSMSAEEAATALAQLASVTGMSGDNYDRLGSTIVALGNNFATTESRISDMSKNIAAAAVNADMNETEILALSAAVTSLGIEAGYGGTAISKLLQEMQAAVVTGEGLEEWAAAAGMSAGEFARLWGEDASSAVLAFISNMGTLGEQMTPTLQTLGIGEARITRVIQSLANAEAQSGTLTNALNLANTAWEENNALTIEAQKRYATTESKLTMLRNTVNYLAVSIGKDLTPALNIGIDALRGFLETLADLNEVIPLLTMAAGAATGFLVTGAIPIIVQATQKIEVLRKALEILKNVWSTNKTALVISAVVGALVALGTALRQTNEDVKEHIKSLEAERDAVADSVKSAEEAGDSYVAQAEALAQLLEKEEQSSAEKAVILNLVEELNSSIPNLSAAYDEQSGKLYNLATGAEIAADAVIALAEAEAKGEYKRALSSGLTELLTQRVAIETEIALLEQERAAYASKAEENGILPNVWQNSLGYRDIISQIEAYREQLEELNPEIEHYKELIGYVEAEEDASSSLESLTKGVDDLTKAYNENVKAARLALQEEIDLFEKMDTKVTASYSTIQSALKSQIKWQENYQKALNNLMGRDIEGLGEFIQRIISQYGVASDEAYQYVMAFSKMTDAQIEKLMGLSGEADKGLEGLAETVGEVETVVDDEMRAILEGLDISVEAGELGGKVGTAYINALRAALGGDVPKVNVLTPTLKAPTKMYHAQGLDYVPYDDYLARLHEGEMVLNRAEARAYRAAETASSTITNATTVNIYPQNLSNAQIDYIYRKFNAKLGGAVS